MDVLGELAVVQADARQMAKRLDFTSRSQRRCREVGVSLFNIFRTGHSSCWKGLLENKTYGPRPCASDASLRQLIGDLVALASDLEYISLWAGCRQKIITFKLFQGRGPSRT